MITGGDASLAPMKDIVAALTSRPFGERLVRHIHHKVLEGDPPLTRSEVLDADANCTPLHDWVINLLLPFQASQRAMMLPAPETAEVRAERDNATAAVASKEKEVAGLRRKLRAAQESEQAAVEFAAQHSPGPASDGPESTSTPAANGSSTLDSGSVGPVPNGTLEVMGQKSLQYRLEEVVVPELQEAVLQSVVKTLLERTESESSSARVEVVGRSEDREDEATAQQRAEAVEAWLLARGVPRERLSVSWAAGGKAIARSTELRLLDVPGKEAKVRQKAETLLRRIQGYPEPAATPASPPEPAVAAPTWQLEELAQQRLRLVFRKAWLRERLDEFAMLPPCATSMLCLVVGGPGARGCCPGSGSEGGSPRKPCGKLARSGGMPAARVSLTLVSYIAPHHMTLVLKVLLHSKGGYCACCVQVELPREVMPPEEPSAPWKAKKRRRWIFETKLFAYFTRLVQLVIRLTLGYSWPPMTMDQSF